MVLGQVIGVEAGAVIGLDQLEAVLVLFAERNSSAVHMVENTELHGSLSPPRGYNPARE